MAQARRCSCECHNFGGTPENADADGAGETEGQDDKKSDLKAEWQGCSHNRGCRADGDCAQEDETLLDGAGVAFNESDAAFEE